jgi:membrane-associated phospholipid phosphatase
LTCAFGAGLLANLVKFTAARSRPYASDFNENVAATFGPWFPAFNADDWDHALQSLPSGHTATAIGLAVGLTWLYPVGRRFFVGMVVLAAAQRIGSGAHWLSDTLFAGGVSLPFALRCVDGTRLSQWFDSRERQGWRLPARLSTAWRTLAAPIFFLRRKASVSPDISPQQVDTSDAADHRDAA